VTRAVVIVNPAAGGGRTARMWRRLRDVMAVTLPAEHAETRGPGDGERLAREAATAGAQLVVAVGGDGTLNEVVNGVRSAGAQTPSAPCSRDAAATPAATSACRAIPSPPCVPWPTGHDARFDLGRAEWTDGRRRWFAISAGAGFDAEVARRAQTWRMRGTLPYLAAVLASVHRHRPTAAVLEVDGVAEPPAPITAVVAANGRWFGGGMKIAPHADPADGAFDIVVLGALGRLELLRWLPTIYPGTHVRHPRVRVRRARRLRVGGTPLPTHVDGEPAGPTPVVLTVEPGALHLRVPRGA